MRKAGDDQLLNKVLKGLAEMYNGGGVAPNLLNTLLSSEPGIELEEWRRPSTIYNPTGREAT